MHVELVEVFRCSASHRDSWLVAAANRSESRMILEGTLGCPVCSAEYAIRAGVARFDASTGSEVAQGVTARRTSPQDESLDDADTGLPMRIAAMLGATDGAMIVALVGVSLDVVTAMQAISPVRCIAADAPDEDGALEALQKNASQLAIVRSSGVLPVAHGALYGVYAGDGNPARHTRALRTSGRLVAPASAPIPPGITELARDATHWVGERNAEQETAPVALVPLRRRR